MAKYREYTKQRHVAGAYLSRVQAEQMAKKLEGKFFEVSIEEGTKGAAWGKSRKVWRVWFK